MMHLRGNFPPYFGASLKNHFPKSACVVSCHSSQNSCRMDTLSAKSWFRLTKKSLCRLMKIEFLGNRWINRLRRFSRWFFERQGKKCRKMAKAIPAGSRLAPWRQPACPFSVILHRFCRQRRHSYPSIGIVWQKYDCSSLEPVVCP